MTFYSKTEQDTYNYAKKLSKNIKSGDILLIEGDLGAGKSVFVRGAAKGLGIKVPMPSPTFTILNEYNGKYKIYHFDFYRINDPLELYEIGFEDYIYSGGVTFIEWPSKAVDLLPKNSIKVNITFENDIRKIEIKWKQ
ncbi:MAG: tRNA (adenosine(37)-N6)-threonylcarbamoyltransferase complex ATPase subunit type 1 TsaE [Spirochaetes bacterium]|nr:tRNA (adenosine(37)-N6)-threonylcarbamoyltransferase complex ATPase subunit type 1 TsaE [Spirochaetota bacterium]